MAREGSEDRELSAKPLWAGSQSKQSSGDLAPLMAPSGLGSCTQVSHFFSKLVHTGAHTHMPSLFTRPCWGSRPEPNSPDSLKADPRALLPYDGQQQKLCSPKGVTHSGVNLSSVRPLYWVDSGHLTEKEGQIRVDKREKVQPSRA